MNMDQLEGNWEELKGQIKEKWGKFTNDDLTTIDGKKDQLIGKLRKHYGYTAEQAKNEFGTFMKNCHCSTDKKTKTKN